MGNMDDHGRQIEEAKMKFIVAQLGARMHYAVPRILSRVGGLARLYTDITAPHSGISWLRKLPSSLQPPALRRLAARLPEGVPLDLLTTFSSLGISYAIRRRLAKNEEQRARAHLWVGRAFGERVTKAGFGAADGVYSFNTAALEIFTAARQLNLCTVLEQTIAPKLIERRLLIEENRAFPAWEPDLASNETTALLIRREQAEWQLADKIVCGSEFVREGIGESGGPIHKCIVVPYGVDISGPKRDRRQRETPLRVLMIGTICLRKGVGYIFQAANRLRGRVQFRLVGSASITESAQAELRKHLELVGSVPRSEIGKHFEWADVFILPSICEGSATVVYEALSHGIPVICTPNTGSVVRDGIEGFIVSPRSADQLVSRLEQLIEDQDLMFTMSACARERAKEFTVEAYAERLLHILN